MLIISKAQYKFPIRWKRYQNVYLNPLLRLARMWKLSSDFSASEKLILLFHPLKHRSLCGKWKYCCLKSSNLTDDNSNILSNPFIFSVSAIYQQIRDPFSDISDSLRNGLILKIFILPKSMPHRLTWTRKFSVITDLNFF